MKKNRKTKVKRKDREREKIDRHVERRKKRKD